ncbi:MAG: hypothetical protein IKA02_01285, partial [Clostridia bacterium]|nr:hypothetical protein [Clostridia bacterium]
INETLVVGKNVTEIAENTLRSSTSVKNIVCMGNITSLNRENLKNDTYPLTYWLCNSEQGDVTANNSSRYTYVICYAEGNESHLENPTKTQYTDADCVNNQKKTATCFCGTGMGDIEVENTALGHEYDTEKGASKVSIAYENYLANGTLKTKCARCEELNETDVLPIISSFKGFSVKENGDGITFGYTIDSDAVKNYESVNNTKIQLGFVVAVKDFLGDNLPLDENGNPLTDKVIKAVVSDESDLYTGADFVLKGTWNKTVNINGADTDIKDVKFYMAGYITDGDVIKYINCGSTSDVASSVSYNECTLVD